MIVGDVDGVVVVPKATAVEVAKAGADRVAREEKSRARLKNGELGLDFYGLRAKLAELGVQYVDEVWHTDFHDAAIPTFRDGTILNTGVDSPPRHGADASAMRGPILGPSLQIPFVRRARSDLFRTNDIRVAG